MSLNSAGGAGGAGGGFNTARKFCADVRSSSAIFIKLNLLPAKMPQNRYSVAGSTFDAAHDSHQGREAGGEGRGGFLNHHFERRTGLCTIQWFLGVLGSEIKTGGTVWPPDL